ncbi:unnamed protein product [Cercospora beticola]|nr:unnamed protein product [Cercospora beticola]
MAKIVDSRGTIRIRMEPNLPSTPLADYCPETNSNARSGPSQSSSSRARTSKIRQQSSFDLNEYENQMSQLLQHLNQTILRLFYDLDLDVNLGAIVWGALPDATERLMQLCLGRQHNEITRQLREAHLLTAYDQLRALVAAFVMHSIFNVDLLSQPRFTQCLILSLPAEFNTLSLLCSMFSRNAHEREATREHARLLITNALSNDINDARSGTITAHITGLHEALTTTLEPCLQRLVTIAETMNGNTNRSSGKPWSSHLSNSLHQFLVDAVGLKVALTVADHSFHWADYRSPVDLTSMASKHFLAYPGKHQVALTVFPGLSVRLSHGENSGDAVKQKVVTTTQIISCHEAD